VATYKTNIGAFQTDAPGSYVQNIGACQTDAASAAVNASIAGGFTGGGSIALDVYVTETISLSAGFTGGGAVTLEVVTPDNVSISGGFEGGGSIMLLGSSAWVGQHDTKQYVIAIGNGQVWICEV